jgi:serine/threonine protein kinase
MTSINVVLGARYWLVRLLGRGGMSDVYVELDEQSGRAVALKIVRSGDLELARRLTHEAPALEKLKLPGPIRLLDTGLAGDQAYFVMELVEGPTLAEK